MLKVTRISEDQFMITGLPNNRKTESLDKILEDLLNNEYRDDIEQKTRELEGRLQRVEEFCRLLSVSVPEFERVYE